MGESVQLRVKGYITALPHNSLNSILAIHPKYQTTATAHSEGTSHEQPEQALQVALD